MCRPSVFLGLLGSPYIAVCPCVTFTSYHAKSANPPPPRCRFPSLPASNL